MRASSFGQFTTMTTDAFRLAAICAALTLFSLVAAAQTDGRSDSARTDTANAPAGKTSVRTPGNATGRPGGVTGSSVRSLPPETQSVRSPCKANVTLDEAGLNAMEQPVLERVNYYRTLAGLLPVAAEPRLLQVAQSHSSYLDSIDEISHYETDKTNPYYRGHSPFDR